MIKNTIQHSIGQDCGLKFEISSKASPAIDIIGVNPQMQLPTENARPSSGHFLRRDFTFDRFVVGGNNDFAYSASLALACRKLGDDACAIDSLSRAIDTMAHDAPNRQKATEYRARWSHSWALSTDDDSERDERLTDALAHTRAWFRLDPSDDNARTYYAETLLAAGRIDEILEEFLPVAESDDRDCSTRLIVARAYNALPNGPTAMRWAEQAANCDPSMADAHVELAAACIHQLHSEYSEAEEVRADRALMTEAADALERALKLDSDDERARALLADARTTLERLRQVENDYTDQANRDAIAGRESIRQACLRILWKFRTEAEALTDDEHALNDEHDCRQYAQ